MDRKRSEVLRPLRRIFDRRLRPGIEWIVRGAIRLGFGDIVREGIELACHGRAMPGQDVGHGLDRGIVGSAPCRLGKAIGEMDPYLVVPSIAHGGTRYLLLLAALIASYSESSTSARGSAILQSCGRARDGQNRRCRLQRGF